GVAGSGGGDVGVSISKQGDVAESAAPSPGEVATEGNFVFSRFFAAGDSCGNPSTAPPSPPVPYPSQPPTPPLSRPSPLLPLPLLIRTPRSCPALCTVPDTEAGNGGRSGDGGAKRQRHRAWTAQAAAFEEPTRLQRTMSQAEPLGASAPLWLEQLSSVQPLPSLPSLPSAPASPLPPPTPPSSPMSRHVNEEGEVRAKPAPSRFLSLPGFYLPEVQPRRFALPAGSNSRDGLGAGMPQAAVPSLCSPQQAVRRAVEVSLAGRIGPGPSFGSGGATVGLVPAFPLEPKQVADASGDGGDGRHVVGAFGCRAHGTGEHFSRDGNHATPTSEASWPEGTSGSIDDPS
ncbi:unnamed protein product, partial [Phaeothamnion confervicola]